MPIATQVLPPKVAQQWAEKALKGQADDWIAPSMYIFYQGRNKIVLLSCVPAIGHLTRLTQLEMHEEMHKMHGFHQEEIV